MNEASDTPTVANAAERGPVARASWLVLGLLFVGIGGVGIVVPGLPTTVFFILAAWAFSKSSPRLEAWVLGLPRIGPMVQDHRDGLGMPRRAKVLAISMIVFFCSLSSWLVDAWAVRAIIVTAGMIGVAYIWFRVPTKEAVLAARAAEA
ncbi:MAG: YbaN family protein [Actinomycetota bacterium]